MCIIGSWKQFLTPQKPILEEKEKKLLLISFKSLHTRDSIVCIVKKS